MNTLGKWHEHGNTSIASSQNHIAIVVCLPNEDGMSRNLLLIEKAHGNVLADLVLCDKEIDLHVLVGALLVATAGETGDG